MPFIARPTTPPLICVSVSERQLPSWAKEEILLLIQELHTHQNRLNQVNQNQPIHVSSPSENDENMASFLPLPFAEKGNESEYSFLKGKKFPSASFDTASNDTRSSTSLLSFSTNSFVSQKKDDEQSTSFLSNSEIQYYLHEPKAVLSLLMTDDPFQVAIAIQMLPFLQILFLNEPSLEFSQAQQVVRYYLKHPTPCVRIAAIQALLVLNRIFGVRYLDSSIYAFFIPLLSDNNPQVRKKAIPLARLFGLMYPGHTIKFSAPLLPNSSASTESTICDISEDVFVRLCDLVNDPNFEIRQHATLELGNFENISTNLLLQTLSKKALGASKKEGRDSTLSKEWKSHAGAFVHAMEDEYQVVRQAALDSISRLGVKHKNFALGAVYFLIDMTNDEMNQIRANALKVLCQISAAYDVVLSPLDLDDLNDVFHDIDSSIRNDLYTFLGTVRCSNQLVLNNMIRALRINLNSFQDDITAIFKCIRLIAEKNYDFVEMEALNILKINPKYVQREERPDDIHYACKLILVWNAALKRPKIRTLLPKFMLKQIPFLTQRYPDAFPPPTWEGLLSTDENPETYLIKHVANHLSVLNMDTNRSMLHDMVMRVRKQCSSRPSPHLCLLLDLVDLYLLAHDISVANSGPKTIKFLQKGIQRIQTIYQIEYQSDAFAFAASSASSSCLPRFRYPMESILKNPQPSSLANVLEFISTMPLLSIQKVTKLYVKLSSPQANTENQHLQVSDLFPFSCELYLTTPSEIDVYPLWACLKWPDLTMEFIPLPRLPNPKIEIPPRNWSDVSSIEISVGQLAGSNLLSNLNRVAPTAETYVQISDSFFIWVRFSSVT